MKVFKWGCLVPFAIIVLLCIALIIASLAIDMIYPRSSTGVAIGIGLLFYFVVTEALPILAIVWFIWLLVVYGYNSKKTKDDSAVLTNHLLSDKSKEININTSQGNVVASQNIYKGKGVAASVNKSELASKTAIDKEVEPDDKVDSPPVVKLTPDEMAELKEKKKKDDKEMKIFITVFVLSIVVVLIMVAYAFLRN